MHRKYRFLLLLFVAMRSLAAQDNVPAQAGPTSYDQALCATAQRLLVNAAETDFAIETLRGSSNGFHTIQMDTDASTRSVTVAAATESVVVDGEELVTSVACKMVDRQRINDVLKLDLPGPEHNCADVNQHTYQTALALLTESERARYLAKGRALEFAADRMAVSGGEWLPARIDDFITMISDPRTGRIYLTISAPSVRVPWDANSREFYQGTQHCKLITLAAMQRWMRSIAFTKTSELFPRAAATCTEPNSLTSKTGSCLFWFAPARAQFCQDYSGAGWDNSAAQAECARRHASAAALEQAGNKYNGTGGIFSPESCSERADVPPLAGTCVFHCRAPDETLWHTLTGMTDSSPAASKMMNRACDLFIEPR